MKFLSDVANRAWTGSGQGRIPLFQSPVQEGHYPLVIFVDVLPSGSFLEEYLLLSSGNRGPSSIRLIFSQKMLVEEIVKQAQLMPLIEEKRIRFWHISEWEDQVDQECMNKRSPLFFCKAFVTAPKDPMHQRLREKLAVKRQELFQEAAEAKECLQQWSKRSSKSLRIYVERSCSSVAVKRFSDACAETFGELGCEVFIHPPCRGGDVDTFPAITLEVEKFRPDFYVASPNIRKSSLKSYLPVEIPTLYCMQDNAPHFDFASDVKEGGLSPFDLLAFLLPSCQSLYESVGIKKEQLMHMYYPVREAPKEWLQERKEPCFDVGFVKTMGTCRSLKDISEFIALKDDTFVEGLEAKLQKVMEGASLKGRYDFLQWVDQPHLHNILESFFHQKFSLYMVESLTKENYTLGLTGKHWDLYSNLRPYALGHAECRRDYSLRFLKNKINLSINPFAQFHTRIFEGGAVGAFFLVYYVPDHESMLSMPKDLIAGEHFDWFISPEDLLEKVAYYLERPQKRHEIGQNLKELIERKYTYRAFCQKVLEKICST